MRPCINNEADTQRDNMRLSIKERLAQRPRHLLTARLRLARWQKRLSLSHYRASLHRIGPMQVTGPDGRPGAELVGVIVDDSAFTIVHTRDLTDEDIAHELLHVLAPEWPHETVEDWTERLIARPQLAEMLVRARNERRYTESHPKSAHLATVISRICDPLDKNGGPAMGEVTAFNLKTRQKCAILNPEVVTLKNGRKAIRGIASDDGKTPVFRILGAAEAQKLGN